MGGHGFAGAMAVIGGGRQLKGMRIWGLAKELKIIEATSMISKDILRRPP